MSGFKKHLKYLFVIGIILFSLPALCMMEMETQQGQEDAFTKQARALLPYNDGDDYPTFDHVWPLFKRHVDVSLKEKWERSLLLMFNHFARPAHPASHVTAGWQCLLAKVLRNPYNPTEQWNGLLDLMKLHEKSLTKLSTATGALPWVMALLHEVAQRPGCANCAQRRLTLFLPPLKTTPSP